MASPDFQSSALRVLDSHLRGNDERAALLPTSGPFLLKRFALVVSTGILVILPLLVWASPESRLLVIQGLDNLAKQQFDEALKRFESAAQTDPSDAEAVFYQGLSLNRLGQHQEALRRLEEAQRMGSTHPDLPFERGWSLLNLRKWEETLRQLDLYEVLSPGRGQTSEFRGRAYYALGQYDKAEALLQEAIRRDPALAPSARLFLALVARAREDTDAAREQLEAIVEQAPDSPLARAIVDQTAGLLRAAALLAKPYRLNLSTAGGFNNNVIALGNSVQLPGDVSSQGAGFNASSLDGSYSWQLGQHDTLTAGYRFLANVYGDISGFDLIDHFNYVDYRHSFRRDLSGSFRLSNQFTQVGGSNFRNQVGLRPAVAWWPMAWMVIETAYSYFNGDYFFPTTRVFDRDSRTQTVAVTGFINVPKLHVQGRVGYFHLWNDADGADFNFQSDGVLVGLTTSLLRRVTAELFYSRTFSRYGNPNSLAGPTGFAFKRDDDIDRVTAQFTWDIFEWLRAYARYDYTREASNITFFDFNQSAWSGGGNVSLP